MASTGNGFWFKVVLAPLLVLAVAGSVAWAWGVNGRVTRNETRIETMGRDITTIKGDVKTLLRLAGSEPSR